MTSHRIDGKAHAAALRRRVADVAAGLGGRHGIVPGLAAILVGEDPASEVYVRSKGKAAGEAGLRSTTIRLPASASEDELLAAVARLNADEAVDGILVQLPLPAAIAPSRVIAAIDPRKDVDGFHDDNVAALWSGGRPGLVPCTPLGCLMLLEGEGVALAGRHAVVLGRSAIVGKPVAALLLSADCTVTIAHSKTPDLPAVCRGADILVAAVGRAGLVRGDWVKPGATVIDVGINRVTDETGSRLVGDVDFAEVDGVAGALTPVPGGVGPMTIACLLRNTVVAAALRRGLPAPAI